MHLTCQCPDTCPGPILFLTALLNPVLEPADSRIKCLRWLKLWVKSPLWNGTGAPIVWEKLSVLFLPERSFLSFFRLVASEGCQETDGKVVLVYTIYHRSILMGWSACEESHSTNAEGGTAPPHRRDARAGVDV